MKNIIAIIWDFDKTLINGYMQDPIFQDYNVDAHEFWTEVNALPKKEHALDLVKETAQTCIEQQIAYSSFDEKQKLEMKENFQEWADTVLQGFKKRLRESGRLI